MTDEMLDWIKEKYKITFEQFIELVKNLSQNDNRLLLFIVKKFK